MRSAEAHDASLEGGRPHVAGVPADAVPHLPGEVEAAPVVLEHLDHPDALLVVLKAAARPSAAQHVVHDALARVAERRVAQVVAQGDRFGQVLVQTAAPGPWCGRCPTPPACA